MDEIDLEYFQLMESTYKDDSKPVFNFVSSTSEILGERVCLDNRRMCSKEECSCEDIFSCAWYMGFADAIELFGRNTKTSEALIESVVSEWRRMKTKEDTGEVTP